jgi:hypothetical protein
MFESDKVQRHGHSFLSDFQSEFEAAQTILYATTDTKIEEVTGKFFCDCQVRCMTKMKAAEMHYN